VAMVARVGADARGDQIIAGFKDEGVDTRYIVRDSTTPTGMSLIQVKEAQALTGIEVQNGDTARHPGWKPGQPADLAGGRMLAAQNTREACGRDRSGRRVCRRSGGRPG
jgi:hypothetical protein